MSQSIESPFFSALFDYLLRERMLDPSDGFTSSLDAIERFQQRLLETPSVHIERNLLNAFTPKQYALRIYRGLPRLYHHDLAAKSKVKQNFASLPHLKRCAAERFIWPLYDTIPPPTKSHVTLFTWVISDGFGDWIAGREALAILRTKFPQTFFRWVCLVPQRLFLPQNEAICIPYDRECPPSLLPPFVIEEMRRSDLILSIPTQYPHIQELMDILRSDGSSPRLAGVGQYGFLESSWFHPRSGQISMGLHFLEKGVFIRDPFSPNFARLENRQLLRILFSEEEPSAACVERYLETTQFYLAYLVSPIGGAIYLHALLASRERDETPIDICTPDIGWLIKHIEAQKKEGKGPLEKPYRVKELEIHFGEQVHTMQIATEGKKVRILCPGPISDADFRLLIRLSGDFVAVRGDQSFSEAVSANRLFFYDGAPHARFFVKDLLALAENRLSGHPSSLAIFRAMGRAFLHTLPTEEGEWVEETHFQEKEPWIEIAQAIAKALQDPNSLHGFRKFNRIVAEEHSFNAALCQLVRRQLILRAAPALAVQEEKWGALFAHGECTLAQTLDAIKKVLKNG